MFYTVGIDVGCNSVKTALMKFDGSGKSEELLACTWEKLRKRNFKDVIDESYRQTLAERRLKHGDIAYVASTG
ncbi:MAG: hypothetical protein HYW49_01890, partial [Deltaproteobacteria bacterium]|nr:hypothetical protein [Deltaproteobacteria bacterium]